MVLGEADNAKTTISKRSFIGLVLDVRYDCVKGADALPWRNPDGRGTGTRADHRFEVRTFRVLGSIALINAIIHCYVIHRFEDYFLCYAGGTDSARLLAHCG